MKETLKAFTFSAPPILAGSALLLAALTIAIWQLRFTATKGQPSYDLPALLASNGFPVDSGALNLDQGKAHNNSYIDLALPYSEPIKYLHTAFQLDADELVQGRERWDDGRLSIIWLDRRQNHQTDYLASVHGNRRSECNSIVNHPKDDFGIPIIRLEHRGTSGSLILSKLHLFPVEESPIWTVGRWIVLAGWFIWAGVLAGAQLNFSPKAWLAGGLWLFVGLHVILPGPWHNTRPLGSQFHVGEVTRGHLPIDQSPSIDITIPPPVGEPKAQGGPLLQVKSALTNLRPLLHLLLFGTPMLLFLFLTSTTRALTLALSLAILAELAQFGLGFGFDKTDVLDIVMNVSGICSAMLLFVLWKRIFRPNSFSTAG